MSRRSRGKRKFLLGETSCVEGWKVSEQGEKAGGKRKGHALCEGGSSIEGMLLRVPRHGGIS